MKRFLTLLATMCGTLVIGIVPALVFADFTLPVSPNACQWVNGSYNKSTKTFTPLNSNEQYVIEDLFNTGMVPYYTDGGAMGGYILDKNLKILFFVRPDQATSCNSSGPVQLSTKAYSVVKAYGVNYINQAVVGGFEINGKALIVVYASGQGDELTTGMSQVIPYNHTPTSGNTPNPQQNTGGDGNTPDPQSNDSGPDVTHEVYDTAQDAKLRNPLGAYGIENVSDAFKKVLDILIMIGVPFITGAIIYAGFLFVKAQGNKDKIDEAKRTLVAVLVGSALLIGASTLSEGLVKTIKDINSPQQQA